METTKKAYYTAHELAEVIGCCDSQAYKLIRAINAKLDKEGYITTKGKVSRYYVHEHWYGLNQQEANV